MAVAMEVESSFRAVGSGPVDDQDLYPVFFFKQKTAYGILRSDWSS
eukprot:COSAG02_NODE_67239_length_253_cov_0.857143_1_plen_45_part_01